MARRTGRCQGSTVGTVTSGAITEDSRKWWVLGAMGMTLFMVMFDESVVGVALVTIRDDLDLSDVAGNWVVNAYMLTLAALVAVGGKLADMYGFRRMFVVGSLVFGGGSLACALAPSGELLIAARAAQGVGAAFVFPLHIAMVMVVFPVSKRGTAIGFLGLMGTGGLSLGPLVGGIFSEYLSWRWIFTVNVVVALVVLALVLQVWAEPERDARPRPFDWLGTITLVASLSALILLIMQGTDWGWTSPAIIGLSIVGVVAGAMFWRRESSIDDPLISVSLFRSSSFVAFNTGVFVAQLGKSAVIVFLPLYLQGVLGYSAIQAGLALMPGMAANALLALPGGRLIDRLGPGTPMLMGLAGLLVVQTALTGLVDVDSYLALLPAVILWGPATVVSFQGSLTGVADSVPVERQGEASGIGNESTMLGGVFGVAVLSALQTGTDRWEIVFGAAAVISLTGFLFAWRNVDRSVPQPTEAAIV